MGKSFVDLEIKLLDRDDVPSYLDCKDLEKVYFLRYRYFRDGVGREFELVFTSLSSCFLKVIDLLFHYYYHLV